MGFLVLLCRSLDLNPGLGLPPSSVFRIILFYTVSQKTSLHDCYWSEGTLLSFIGFTRDIQVIGSHGQNLGSTLGQAEQIAPYFFENSTTDFCISSIYSPLYIHRAPPRETLSFWLYKGFFLLFIFPPKKSKALYNIIAYWSRRRKSGLQYSRRGSVSSSWLWAQPKDEKNIYIVNKKDYGTNLGLGGIYWISLPTNVLVR